jgi:putative sterol carrier protein
MLMNLGVRASRWGGNLAGGESQRAELRGLRGAMNIEFIGDDGGATWNVRFDDGRVTMGKGPAADSRATVRVNPKDYLAMVAGDLGWSTARMTGKVRVVGDGHFGMTFGASVEGLKAGRRAKGLRGWVVRFVTNRAFRKGGYQPKALGRRTT